MRHLNSILADADAGKGGLGVLLKDPKFAKDLGDTLAQTDELIANINQGKGTLGKFATDEAVYDNLNKMLVEMIRADVCQATVTKKKNCWNVLGLLGGRVDGGIGSTEE